MHRLCPPHPRINYIPGGSEFCRERESPDGPDRRYDDNFRSNKLKIPLPRRETASEAAAMIPGGLAEAVWTTRPTQLNPPPRNWPPSLA